MSSQTKDAAAVKKDAAAAPIDAATEATEATESEVAGKLVVMTTTPKNVVAARSKEKKNLQQLNDKLGSYIGETTALSAENKRLRHDLDALNAIFASLDERLRKQYGDEIKGLRDALDKALADKEAALKKVSNLESDLAKSEAALKKESSDHEKTKKRIPQMEKMIVERDSQIEFLMKNVSTLQEELKISKKKIGDLKIEIAASQRNSDIILVEQIQFESKLQTKDDEIAFLRSVYEEQIELLSQIEICNNNICCPEHLIETLKDIRADYDAVLQAREAGDPDAWYKSKFDQVMKIGEQKQEALAQEKKKVNEWRKKYEKAKDDCDILEKLADGEKKKCDRAEEILGSALEEHTATVEEKNEAIEALKAEFAQLFEIVRRLVDPNLALSAEVNEAKKLLEAGGKVAETA